MAKKKKVSKGQKKKPLFDNVLPQNILPIGERVEENKSIYISQPVYKEIHKFTQNKTTDESGGMLVGRVVEEFGKTHVIVEGFVEAKNCEATPTTLKFTHETWEYCHKMIDRKFPGRKIVGWIHTHPNFGIFLSEYDKFIQENFFQEEHQIAYVIDPIQKIEGFYFWNNGKIERCGGYFIFDKMGVKIQRKKEREKEDRQDKEKHSGIKDVIISVLALCVVFLLFSNVSQNQSLKKLQKQQRTLETQVQQYINQLHTRILILESAAGDGSIELPVIEFPAEELPGETVTSEGNEGGTEENHE